MDKYQVLGLEHSWVNGEAVLERPAHLFAGFGAQPSLRVGAFSYSQSHVTPNVAAIGRYCSIADSVTFGHQEHPTRWLSTSSFTYDPFFMSPTPGERMPDSHFTPQALGGSKKRTRITIGHDVWIGYNAYIRSGVALGDGCIIGAKSVVTKDVPPFAIVVGNPARIIRYRFDKGIIRRLNALQWWRYEFTRFKGVDVRDVSRALASLEKLIAEGLQPFEAPIVVLRSAVATHADQCERTG